MKARLKGLKGLAVPGPGGRTLLTKEGLERYLFLRSQEAIGFFETRGVAAKSAFGLKTLTGRAVFDEGGLLTEEGLSLFEEALAGPGRRP